MSTMIFWFAVAFALVDVTSQTTLRAVFNMGGINGTISFNQDSADNDVSITLNLANIPQGNYSMDLHEFRVNYDVGDLCAITAIGGIIGSAQVTSGVGTLQASGMDLSGSKSIEGRSLVFTDSNQLRVCATIEADTDYITAFAHLPAGLGGTIIFRQQEGSASADTVIYTDLFFVQGEKITTPLQWQINSGSVKMDIDASTDLADRCGNTIGALYNPIGESGARCTTEIHGNCKIGDLSAKHDDITIGAVGNTKAFYADLMLPLSGPNSIIGKTIAFLSSGSYIACANIVQYPKMAAVAKFSNDGVKGMIEFTQKSPLDIATINVDLSNMNFQGGGYHVHQWPVPQKLVDMNSVCSGTSVGGHFDPFNAIANSPYPSPASTTPDMYEVGDISGKFGLLAQKNNFNESFQDPNLQLYGKNTILGRSMVIHKDMTGAPRWVCSTIFAREDIPMMTAVAKFTYPVIGYMVFWQPKDMWFAETQIYAELDYGTSSSKATFSHSWHIHETSMGDDMLKPVDRCKSVGGHYNPYNVLLSGDYGSQCSTSNQLRCEVGDLSGKHGKLNIRSAASQSMKYFFSDYQLPLTGPQSIVGKSVVIHDANSGGGRLACADIMEKKPRMAAVTSWSSADGQKAPTGSITFIQDCTDFFACKTKIDVRLSGLHALAGGYHVHEFPVDISMPRSKVCQGPDVGGHVNPFGASYPGPANTEGTMDKYEIGDLSGKFSPLTGEAYTSSVWDNNLPMKGQLSIVGRSVVIHKNDASASRWACGTIGDITEGTRLVQAKATFTGEVRGSVILSQYIYANGDKSDTTFLLDLSYPNSTKTTGHNWHVHESPVTNGCASCGQHYNPFMVDMTTQMYSVECKPNNPLRCEVGDQAGKLEPYTIGSGKRFYTDVNLDLEGKYAVAKRSIVVHGQNRAGARIACANLLPYGDDVRKYDLTFPTVTYSTAELEAKVAQSISTDVHYVLGEDKFRGLDCTTVTVYFIGKEKNNHYTQFRDVIKSYNHNKLGKFSPTDDCTSAAGYLQIYVWTMIVACVVLIRNTLSF